MGFKVPCWGLHGAIRDISSSGASNPGLEETFSGKMELNIWKLKILEKLGNGFTMELKA